MVEMAKNVTYSCLMLDGSCLFLWCWSKYLRYMQFGVWHFTMVDPFCGSWNHVFIFLLNIKVNSVQIIRPKPIVDFSIFNFSKMLNMNIGQNVKIFFISLPNNCNLSNSNKTKTKMVHVCHYWIKTDK